MKHTLKRLLSYIPLFSICLTLGAPPSLASASPCPADGDAAVYRLTDGDAAVPRMETAAEQLRHAAAVKHSMRGLEEPDKAKTRALAVEAYRALLEFFPEESALCAEASFRAGELLRAGGDVVGALASFREARERGAKTPFQARSGVEIGHIHRRAKDAKAALEAYGTVMEDPHALPGYRDEATLWAGRVWHDTDRRDQALGLWEKVAQSGEDPMDRIRAFDYLALDLVEADDLEGAAGMLERCREELGSVAEEETRLGERVRKSLTRMRAVRALQKAIDSRANTAQGEQG
jgi:tetratricopeptide (TPR) repeat protein